MFETRISPEQCSVLNNADSRASKCVNPRLKFLNVANGPKIIDAKKNVFVGGQISDCIGAHLFDTRRNPCCGLDEFDLKGHLGRGENEVRYKFSPRELIYPDSLS